MAQNGESSSKRPIRAALDPISSPYLSSWNGTFSIAKEVLMGSIQSEHRRSESVRILSDRRSDHHTSG